MDKSEKSEINKESKKSETDITGQETENYINGTEDATSQDNIDRTQILGRGLLKLFRECLDSDYNDVGRSASYALRHDGEHLYIFFECSNGIEDWLNNLDFRYVPYDSGGDNKEYTSSLVYVHNGFMNVWQSVKPYIYDAVEKSKPEYITVVGYSHGAALAVLCYDSLIDILPDNVDCYAFGAPRVLAFSDATEEGEISGNGYRSRFGHCYIIRNLNDLVTHLPPSALGYRHVGNIIDIGERGKYSCYDCPDIDAHRPESYLNELSEIAFGK